MNNKQDFLIKLKEQLNLHEQKVQHLKIAINECESINEDESSIETKEISHSNNLHQRNGSGKMIAEHIKEILANGNFKAKDIAIKYAKLSNIEYKKVVNSVYQILFRMKNLGEIKADGRGKPYSLVV